VLFIEVFIVIVIFALLVVIVIIVLFRLLLFVAILLSGLGLNVGSGLLNTGRLSY
jgi:hypothetical protein